MANPPQNQSKVSPDALAAFYRHRSESLRQTSTVKGQQDEQLNQSQKLNTPKGQRPTMGVLEYVISALQGHPGHIEQ